MSALKKPAARAGIECAVTAAICIEIEKGFDVLRRDRPAVGSPRQRCKNLPRAGVFGSGVFGATHINLPPAGRIVNQT